jgi:hypothetical protein
MPDHSKIIKRYTRYFDEGFFGENYFQEKKLN